MKTTEIQVEISELWHPMFGFIEEREEQDWTVPNEIDEGYEDDTYYTSIEEK